MTPQERKIMELALEALGAYMSATDSEEDAKAHNLMAEAFFKIKEALAEPEQVSPMSEPNRAIAYAASGKLHELGYRYLNGEWMQTKEPEQGEPVAWIHNFIDGGISIGKRPADLNRHPDRWTALYKEPKPCPTCEALARTVMLDQTSHDTTPPQRTWVGLDEEDDIDWEEGGSLRDLVKAVEAKLRSKNNV